MAGECEHCGAKVTRQFDWVLSKIDDPYTG